MRETRTAQQSIFDFYTEHEYGKFLEALSDLLDENTHILELIEADLLTPGTKPTGRIGLSVESIFRCMLIKQISQTTYDELSFLLADSQSYRTFARLDVGSQPKKSTLCENIRRLKPQILQTVFESLGIEFNENGLIDTETMRLDSTVVQSNIVSPSDSQLLNDGVRVLCRLFSKSKDQTGVKLRMVDYREQARKLSASIFYEKKSEKNKLYVPLIKIAEKVVKQSYRAVDQVQFKSTDKNAMIWICQVEHYQGLLENVIKQTTRRVINGEKVPSSEKLVSLFEPHTDIIVKSNREIEYGHKINLSTDKNGFITTLMIEEGNPADSERFLPILDEHERLYGCTPETTIADGCYASINNVNKAKEKGVKRPAFHKKRGISVSMMGIKEKTLKKLRAFRAGIEANISELKRSFGAGKATWKGESGFQAFVWASAISYNLTHRVRMDSG